MHVASPIPSPLPSRSARLGRGLRVTSPTTRPIPSTRVGPPGAVMKPPSLTIGIEEEYQIIDPVTGELKSYITQILEDGKLTLREQIKAELHQSMVEVASEVCRTPADVRAELIRLRKCVSEL